MVLPPSMDLAEARPLEFQILTTSLLTSIEAVMQFQGKNIKNFITYGTCVLG